MAQVAGRAGRRKKQGHVIIQASDTQHPVIQFILNGDHKRMYAREMAQRKHFDYPPYTRLIRLTVKHRSKQKTENIARSLAMDLKANIGERVLGPEFPAVERVRNKYQMNILIKIERERSPKHMKSLILEIISELLSRKGNSALRISIDVDPM
jgi:primosomal protein N' (replication factor Y)